LPEQIVFDSLIVVKQLLFWQDFNVGLTLLHFAVFHQGSFITFIIAVSHLLIRALYHSNRSLDLVLDVKSSYPLFYPAYITILLFYYLPFIATASATTLLHRV